MSGFVGKTCPYCQFPVKPGEASVICSACGLPHHARCWEENGRCTTFGCNGQPLDAAAAPAAEARSPVDLTGEEIRCQFCGTDNQLDAAFCKNCGANLSNTPAVEAAIVSGRSCPGCGRNNPPVAAFCAGCGSALEPQVTAGAPPPMGQPEISTYLWPAILSTLCCFLPTGVVGIVYAAKVQSRLETGDYPGALEASKKAAIWCWVTFGLGIAVGIITVVTRSSK